MCQSGHLSPFIFSDLARWPQMAEGSGDPWGLQPPLQNLAAASNSCQISSQRESKCEIPQSELRESAPFMSHQEPRVLVLNQTELCKQKSFTSPGISDKSEQTSPQCQTSRLSPYSVTRTVTGLRNSSPFKRLTGWGYSWLVQHLPNTHKALTLIPRAT